ncbi:MAG: hypothetical protein JWO82_3572 [Akkermansiaceae bacterium]|nr:hypothetical protein [Akkermansiaceae bacterium]
MRTWYYARNGRQFGPVGLDQIKLMLGTGGLDREDLVWHEGMPAWLPAGEIEELNPPVVEAEIMPPPLPASAQEGPERPAEGEDIPPGTQPILITVCLAHAWRTTKQNALRMLMAGSVYFLTVATCALIGQAIDDATGYQLPKLDLFPSPEKYLEMLRTMFGVLVRPTQLVQMLVDSFLTLGLMRLTLNLIRHEGRTDPNVIFSPVKRLPKVVIADLLFYAMVFLGSFLILPGIYLGLRYGQYRYAILEKNLSIREAFSFSARVTANSLLALLALGLISTALTVLMLMTSMLAAIAVMPFLAMIKAAAYHWLTRGAKDAFEGK